MSARINWHFPVRAANDDICKHNCEFQCHTCMLAEKEIMTNIRNMKADGGSMHDVDGYEDVWSGYGYGSVHTPTPPVIHVPSFTKPKLLKPGEVIEVENIEIDQTLRLKEGVISHA
jgi:hypothetical protein